MDPNSNPQAQNQQAVPPEQFPPTQTPNEIEQTKKVSRRLVFLVSFILAILIPAGIFAYSKYQKAKTYPAALAPTPVSSPKPAKATDPTADWQTYNFDSFTIKYPADWFLIPCPNGNDCIYDNPPSYSKNYSNIQDPSKKVEISINQDDLSAVTHGASNSISQEGFYSTESNNWWVGNHGGGIELNYMKPTLLTLGTNKYIKQISSIVPGAVPSEGNPPTQDDYNKNSYEYYFYVSNNRVLSFRTSLPKTDSQDLAQVEKVLSTFTFAPLSTSKFTEQKSPAPTCRPRPACLDATPRCMIPETSDMCPPKIK